MENTQISSRPRPSLVDLLIEFDALCPVCLIENGYKGVRKYWKSESGYHNKLGISKEVFLERES